MTNTILTRTEMVEQLLDRNCTVVFTKVDGTERTMKCTLSESVLEDTSQADRNDKTSKAFNENVLAVWDIDAAGWRSFRVDSVTSFK